MHVVHLSLTAPALLQYSSLFHAHIHFLPVVASIVE